MRSSTLFLAAIALLSSACTHAPAPTPSSPPTPSIGASDPAGVPPERSEPSADPQAHASVEPDPGVMVLVMEADDLGGGPDTITAPPQRPSLPSMMTDIAMAPSR